MQANPEDRAAIESMLAASDLFAALGAADLRVIADTAQTRTLRTGETLWELASRPDEMTVVLEGRLDVERDTARGRRILRRLDAGSVVGLSLVAGEPTTARLVAGVPTRIALLPGAPFREMLARQPDLALRMIGELGALVGRLTDELIELQSGLTGRVAAWLLRESLHGRQPIEATQARVAAQVGAERANVSRELERLRDAGILRLGRGRIEVLRPKDLHPGAPGRRKRGGSRA